jgi:hypothetical protein
MGLVLVHAFSVQTRDKPVQVNTIGKLLTELVSSIPFKFGDVSSDVDRPEFVTRDFPNDLSSDREDLDFHVLRNFASSESEHERCGTTKRVRIVQQIRDHWLRDHGKGYTVFVFTCLVPTPVFTFHDQFVFVAFRIILVGELREEIHDRAVIRRTGCRSKAQRVVVEMMGSDSTIRVSHLHTAQCCIVQQKKTGIIFQAYLNMWFCRNNILIQNVYAVKCYVKERIQPIGLNVKVAEHEIIVMMLLRLIIVGVELEESSVRIDVVFDNESSDKVVYPGSFGVGVMYYGGDKWLVGADFSQSKWSQYEFFGQKDMVTDSWKFNMGGQILPNLTGAKSYWGRVTYRAGFFVGRDYIKADNELPMWGASIGFGLPMRPPSYSNQYSIINTSFEFGQRGNNANAIRENFFRLGLGFTLSDIWFIKRRYD